MNELFNQIRSDVAARVTLVVVSDVGDGLGERGERVARFIALVDRPSIARPTLSTYPVAGLRLAFGRRFLARRPELLLLLSPARLSRAVAPSGLSGILGSFIIISAEVRSLISNWTSGSRREIRGPRRGSVAPSPLRC